LDRIRTCADEVSRSAIRSRADETNGQMHSGELHVMAPTTTVKDQTISKLTCVANLANSGWYVVGWLRSSTRKETCRIAGPVRSAAQRILLIGMASAQRCKYYSLRLGSMMMQLASAGDWGCGSGILRHQRSIIPPRDGLKG
jgi:hypothetical protein